MGVRSSSAVDLNVAPDVALAWVNDLGRYPLWMPLVHSVDRVDDQTWDVELRATVGVLARSKKLRMTRTVSGPERVVFERSEADGRVHASWVLEASVLPTEHGCRVTMEMSYGGTLWTAGVLDRVLARHIEIGKQGLARVVQGA